MILKRQEMRSVPNYSMRRVDPAPVIDSAHRRPEIRPMLDTLRNIHPVFFLIVATLVEVSGDAVIRLGIYNHAGLYRLALFAAGAALLFGYGTFLNLAPLEFRQVVGLYIATLFLVWQVINFAFFRTLPTGPILVGGSLIVTGGLIVTFWKV